MSNIQKISLAQRKWAEEEKHYVEPVVRVRFEDGSKTDYCFRWAPTETPISLLPGVFFMIDKQLVWSSVKKFTVTERYVINVQRAGEEPITLQSFRLFPVERGKIGKPTHWMWNEGPLEEPFASERRASEPISLERRWKVGPPNEFELMK